MYEIEGWLSSPQFSALTEIADDNIRERMQSSINLIENTTRGLLGEVLVAHALGGQVTAPWDPWDVVLPSGVRLEVKTTGVVQAWSQSRLGAVSWGIAARAAWQMVDGGYVWDPLPARRSDWYIFCLHNGIKPGDTDEWTFRPVRTTEINSLAEVQRSIRARSLDRLFGPPILAFSDLMQWADEMGLL